MKQIKSFAQKAGRTVLIIFSILLACVLVLTGVFLTWSPGKVKPFVDENGVVLPDCIAEKTHVTINGVEQGMIITGKNMANPVLLLVHGGPGMPNYVFADGHPTGIEDYFTVCWWDQRGGGLSFDPNSDPELITVEQLVSDTIEVTNYLRERFGQEKIYLMGYSWGTIPGIQAAAQAPELYNAYIGMSQITNELESGELAYEYIMEQYTATGDSKMAQRLEKDFQNTHSVSDEVTHRLGVGTTRDMDSVITGIFWPVMQHPVYTLSEKINIWRGRAFLRSSTDLFNELSATDIPNLVPKLEIPTYLFGGRYDYTVSSVLAKEYLQKLQVPVKGFYTFEESAHSPLFEEPEKGMRILREDVLNGTTSLADTE